MNEALLYSLELYNHIYLLSVQGVPTFEDMAMMDMYLEELRETILYLINLEGDYERI